MLRLSAWFARFRPALIGVVHLRVIIDGICWRELEGLGGCLIVAALSALLVLVLLAAKEWGLDLDGRRLFVATQQGLVAGQDHLLRFGTILGPGCTCVQRGEGLLVEV